MLRPRPERREGQDIREHIDERQAWHNEARRALSLGHVDGATANAAGYHGNGHDQDSYGLTWKPLPHTLYHVTTNVPAVHEHGLRSRDELTQKQGLGLGGGESDTISFTDDPKVADDIHKSLHEFHQVVNGHKSIRQMYDEAKSGHGADQPWHEFIHGVDYGGDENSPHLQAHLEGRKYQQGMATQEEKDATGEKGWEPHPLSGEGWKSPKGTVHTAWHRPMTEDEHRERRAAFYKTYAAGRDHAGGAMYPGFFDTDVHGFAKADPKHFGVVKAHPKPGAQGFQVAALGEWRTATGDAVEVDREHQKQAGWLHNDAMGDQDWDEVYHDVPEHIHRGLGVHLPDDLHRFVHDDSKPTEERARALLRHLHSPEARTNPYNDDGPHWDHRTGLGTSWSGTRSVSEQFAADNADRHTEKGNSDAIRDKDHRWGTSDDEDKDPVGKPGTAVVVTIHKPQREDIDEDGVNGDGSGMRYTFHGHSENEVPLHSGTMHEVHQVSWQPVIHWSHPDYATDREPKETTHTFERLQQHVEASLRGGQKTANRPNYNERGRQEHYRFTGHEPEPGQHAIFRGLYLGRETEDTKDMLDPASVMSRIRAKSLARRTDPHPERLNDFGAHWSTDASTAHSFSLDPQHGQWRSPRREGPPLHGAVVELHTTEEPKTTLSQYGESELNSIPLRKHVTKAWLHIHRAHPDLEAPTFKPGADLPAAWPQDFVEKMRHSTGEVPFGRQNTLVHSIPIPLRDLHTGLRKQASSPIHEPYTDVEDPKHVYLRFGDWPEDERSSNHVEGWKEEGVSVYHMNKHGHPIDPDHAMKRDEHDHEYDEHLCNDDGPDGECTKRWNDIYTNDTGDEMRGRVAKAERYAYGGGHRASQVGHLVTGDYVGIGHDGEPLLNNVTRVGDWVHHRHHFIPTAEPHRLHDPEEAEEDEDFQAHREDFKR